MESREERNTLMWSGRNFSEQGEQGIGHAPESLPGTRAPMAHGEQRAFL